MKSITGMSLLELLISLGILAILLGIAIPDFSELSESISGELTLRKLATAVQLGKSTAITNDTTVTLCKSADVSPAVAAGKTAFSSLQIRIAMQP